MKPAMDFDPLGFANKTDLDQMKAWREAETNYGRVACSDVSFDWFFGY